MIKEYDIKVEKGTTAMFVCTVQTVELDYSTTPSTETYSTKNLTNYTAKLIVKQNINDADDDALFELTGTIDAPASGVIVFNINRENNNKAEGVYYYEVVIYDNSSTVNYYVVMKGKYIIEQVVKKSIT